MEGEGGKRSFRYRALMHQYINIPIEIRGNFACKIMSQRIL